MPKKINGFAKYLFDLKKSHPDLSMGEVQKIAGEKWQAMDDEERGKYKSGSNKSDGEFKDTRVRYNCLGESIEEVRRQAQEKRNKEKNEMMFIDDLIKAAIDNNNLLFEEFYLFSASYFIKTSQEDIYPAEIGLAKFSLNDGITDVLHIIINPGPLPIGYSATALQHSKKTHRFDIPPTKLGEKNYSKILNEILKFLNVKELSTRCVPPFYVYNDFQGDEYEAACLTLKKIADENRLDNGFRVLKADELLFLLNKQILLHLNKEEKMPMRSMVQARETMRRDSYMYSEIGCDIHNNDDNSKECALSKVKRWGFIIAENCGLDCINKIPGQHFPIYSTVSEYDSDDDVDSVLTESFHQLQMGSTASQTDLESLYNTKTFSVSSQLNLSIKSSGRFVNPMRSNISLPGTTISNFNSMQSVTNIDDTVKGFEESWTKNLVNNQLDDE